MAVIVMSHQRRNSLLLVAGSVALLAGLVAVTKYQPSEGLLAYQWRAQPALILGTDKITPRKAKMLRMGLLKMSPTFKRPEELASNSKAAQTLFGGPCPAPDARLLGQDMPPSTALLPEIGTTPEGVTVVSVVCASEDLFDPVKGIVIHPMLRGKTSERVAWLSARRGSDLLVETPIGFRIHGGHSRGSPEKSFTAVFRENYSGFSMSPPGLFFGADTPAARQFILLNAGHTSRFNGALAAEIATLVGCHTSRLTPAVVYLNGTRLKSPYFLYQQQSPDFVSARFGIEQPDWYRLKGINLHISSRFNAMRNWIRACPPPISMREAALRYDLADLNNWILTMTFTSTRDNNQGSYFVDKAHPTAPWRSLTWDLDCAFHDVMHKTDKGWIDYSRDPFAALNGYRAELFLRLFYESPEYRAQFMAFAKQHLATTLHRDRMLEMTDRYIQLAIAMTSPNSITTKVMKDTREFFMTRHSIFWEYLERKAQEAENSVLADREKWHPESLNLSVKPKKKRKT